MDRISAGSAVSRDHPVNPVHPVLNTPRGSRPGVENDSGDSDDPPTQPDPQVESQGIIPGSLCEGHLVGLQVEVERPNVPVLDLQSYRASDCGSAHAIIQHLLPHLLDAARRDNVAMPTHGEIGVRVAQRKRSTPRLHQDEEKRNARDPGKAGPLDGFARLHRKGWRRELGAGSVGI